MFKRPMIVVPRLDLLILSGLMASGLLLTGLPAAAQIITPTAIPPCPGAAAPKLIVNELARVTPGSPDNVRSAPTKTADIVTQISENDEVLVTGAPTCADGYLWWPVHTLNGFDGWVAEGDKQSYFILPTTGAVQTYQLTGSTPLTVTYDHFQLSYPPDLATVLGTALSTTTVLPFTADPNAGPVQSNPAYDRWGFGARTIANVYSWPTLSIFPVKQVEAVDDTSRQAIDAAIAFLKNNTDPASVDSIPMYPLQLAGQVIHAQNKPIAFNGGSGLRFVAYYASDVSPITNDRPLRYQFIGLTKDGRYFLFFSADVTTVALNGNDTAFPNMNDPNIATLYPKYLKDTTAKLDAAAPTDFSISLDQLDTLLESITAKP